MTKATTATFAEFVFEVEWIEGSGVYTRACGITDVQFTRTANVDSTEVPDCDDESLPLELLKEVRSLEFAVSASGVWARESHEAILAWFYSAVTKRARIGHLASSLGDTEYEGGDCILTGVNNARTKGQKVTGGLEFAFSGDMGRIVQNGPIPPDDFSTPASLSMQFGVPVDESSTPLTYQLLAMPTRATGVKKFGAASMRADQVAEGAIQLASNIDFSDDDFTIEFFAALSGEPITSYFGGRWGASGNRAWIASYDASQNRVTISVSTDGAASLTAYFDLDTDGVDVATFFDGAMHHVAFVRNGATLSAYVDGIAGAVTAALGTDAIFNGGTNYTYLGGSAVTVAGTIAGQWPGYLDELRISTMARYTGAFTPPVAAFGRNVGADANFATVKALFGFEGNFAVTQSGAVTNPLVLVGYGLQGGGPFDIYGLRGKTSFTFPYVASDAHFGFGAGDFTIELFGARNVGGGWGATLRQLLGCWSTLAGERAWRFLLTAAGRFAFEYSADGSTTIERIEFAGIVPVADTSYNLAVVREGVNLYLYCDGSRVAAVDISGSLFNPNGISLPLGVLCGMTTTLNSGDSCAVSTRVKGLRVSKALARYQGDSYSVPTFPLP